MGDMKTPDFDDLLAAFDIPDIDAKEAIQSNHEEQRDEVEICAPGCKDEISSCFPCPAIHQSEPPVVSVIVKNTVRSDSLEEEQTSIKYNAHSISSSALASHLPELPAQFSSKLSSSATMEPQLTNGLEEAVPTNPEISITWSRSSPLRSALNENEGDKRADTTDAINSMRPLLYPQTLLNPGPTAALSHSSPTLTKQLSPHPCLPDEASSRDNPLSASLPQNGKIKDEIKCNIDTDDDSEPDLGSPLVIHESPKSTPSSPPKFRHKTKLHSDFFASLESPGLVPHAANVSFTLPPMLEHQHEDSEQTATTPPLPVLAPQPRITQDSKNSVMVREEKYPEHVIEERDSPESPPPSETGLIYTNQKPTVNLDLIVDTTTNHKEINQQQEEPMEVEHRNEEKSIELDEAGGNVKDKEKLNKSNSQAVSEGACSASETTATLLKPLKVKIKMSTGSVTRTVTGGIPKKSGKVSTKNLENTKASAELHTRSKKEILQQTELAVATAQEVAGCLKENVLAESKAKVSSTAVSITKTAALPTVSSGTSQDVIRSLGKKTLKSGITLPTPVTGSRPASIVNSTGAIISKSQTSLVEAFNKILNNKNLLPTYKPDLKTPLAEWGISLPAQGYRCLECGDSFVLEKSLAQHYDRRSLRIEVTCNHCAKRLAFFNKCSLLLHAREHKEKGLIMQCSHLVMKPILLEQMISQQEAAAGQAATNQTVQAHTSGDLKKEAEIIPDTKCSECQAEFGNKREKFEHFQETKASQSATCTECSPPMLLPNSCSATAHQRIHQSASPHICPECGSNLKQSQFEKHLHEACLHFSRRIGYRCSSCQVVFGGLNSVKSHIQQAHCEMFHKCPSCPMAFKSAPSIQSHIISQHPVLTDGQSMLIYKCVMCDTVFTHKPLLYAHFDTHLANQKVHVFKCPECTKLFSQRTSLLDHFKTHKTFTSKEEPSTSHLPVKFESSEGEELGGKQKEGKVKTERMKAPSKWKCSTCGTLHTEREDYIAHMSEQHGKILKKFPCNKCESSFTTTSSMRRHIRDKHKGSSRGFRCQFCSESKKSFSSRALLDRHVQLRHGDVSRDTLTKANEAESSSEQDGGTTSRRRRRGAAKVEQDEEPTEKTSLVKKPRASSSSPAPPPPPSAVESGYVCAPCGFTTENKAAFLEHIGQHRRGADGGGPQCLQCGACFTSTSSLSRHRFIMHKVRDDGQQAPSAHPSRSPAVKNHENATSLNGSAPSSPSAQSGPVQEEEGALACKVCGKCFEKATDLNTHFRTHGMAFIIARNAGKTT